MKYGSLTEKEMRGAEKGVAWLSGCGEDGGDEMGDGKGEMGTMGHCHISFFFIAD